MEYPVSDYDVLRSTRKEEVVAYFQSKIKFTGVLAPMGNPEMSLQDTARGILS